MRRQEHKPVAPKRKGIGEEASAYIVPAADRAARILSLLKTEGREMTIAEIADATGWHKGSVHRLLVTLNYHQLVDRDVMTKRYSLGVALLEYGRIALKGLDIRHVAKSFLKDLVDYSGETASLSVLRGTKITIVDVEESPNPMLVSINIGMAAPATTTSNGKVVLAYLPESQLKEIIRIEGLPSATKKSITSIRAYRAELATVRKRGYATDFGEYQEWIAGVSAPVFDARGQVLGALSVAGPLIRMPKEKVRNYGKKCAEMTSQLSAMLR